ncbi:MAG: hypothetical protein AAGI03_00545 [Pseudomonadota bacterium]
MITTDIMVRKNLNIPPALWKLVEEYRWNNRLESETLAVVDLLKKALEVEGDEYDPAPRGRPKSADE